MEHLHWCFNQPADWAKASVVSDNIFCRSFQKFGQKRKFMQLFLIASDHDVIKSFELLSEFRSVIACVFKYFKKKKKNSTRLNSFFKVFKSSALLGRLLVGSLKMNTTLEYSTRVVQKGDRRCIKSTLNDLAYLTPLRIPLMNPVYVYNCKLYRNPHVFFSAPLEFCGRSFRPLATWEQWQTCWMPRFSCWG